MVNIVKEFLYILSDLLMAPFINGLEKGGRHSVGRQDADRIPLLVRESREQQNEGNSVPSGTSAWSQLSVINSMRSLTSASGVGEGACASRECGTALSDNIILLLET